jgi:hypothetical protein
MIKIIRDNYRIYGLIIVKTTKKSLVLDYGLLNTTFETPNHVFIHAYIYGICSIIEFFWTTINFGFELVNQKMFEMKKNLNGQVRIFCNLSFESDYFSNF